MDFTTNYCGMYWSDGKFQSSVSDGTSVPVNALDLQCKVHDADYHLASTLRNREQRMEAERVADDKFHQGTKSLGLRGRLYGALVKKGNKVLRAAERAIHRYDGEVVPEPAKVTEVPVRMPVRTGKAKWDATEYVEAFVYDPRHPSHVVVRPAQKPVAAKAPQTKAKVATTEHNTPIVLRDPELLGRHSRDYQRPYKPLKKKKIKKTDSLINLHKKYNPPTIKTIKVKNKKCRRSQFVSLSRPRNRSAQ